MQLLLRLDLSGLEPTYLRIYGQKWLKPPDISLTEHPQGYWTRNRLLRLFSPIKVYLILYRASPILRYMAVEPTRLFIRSLRNRNSD
jgi:hypothetical protein